MFSQWKTPTDWPWTLSTVVGEARRILVYVTEYAEENRPPIELWHSPHKCHAYVKAHLPGADKPEQGMLEFDSNEIELAR